MITGTANVDTSKVDEVLLAAARRSVSRLIDRIGRECTEEIAQEAADTYSTTRPEARRRSSPRLSDPSAYNWRNEPLVGKKAAIEIYVQAGEDFKAKFFSLNNGSQGHVIFPRAGLRPNARLAYNRDNPESTEPNYFPRIVHHPGTTGSHYYERSIARVVARYRR